MRSGRPLVMLLVLGLVFSIANVARAQDRPGKFSPIDLLTFRIEKLETAVGALEAHNAEQDERIVDLLARESPSSRRS